MLKSGSKKLISCALYHFKNALALFGQCNGDTAHTVSRLCDGIQCLRSTGGCGISHGYHSTGITADANLNLFTGGLGGIQMDFVSSHVTADGEVTGLTTLRNIVLIHACKLACAHEFIEGFPNQYDTHIEQGGTNVSGGQKQRLCIARALLKKPKILILDDSTSAVDTRTDAMIRKAFKEEIPGTTKLIIAQRVASVQDADLIVVLDGGQIAAAGKHDQLLQKSDIYREVYESQVKGGEE